MYPLTGKMPGKSHRPINRSLNKAKCGQLRTTSGHSMSATHGAAVGARKACGGDTKVTETVGYNNCWCSGRVSRPSRKKMNHFRGCPGDVRRKVSFRNQSDLHNPNGRSNSTASGRRANRFSILCRAFIHASHFGKPSRNISCISLASSFSVVPSTDAARTS